MEENPIETKILEFLKSRNGEPTTAKELQNALGISYPTLSKYLLSLKSAGKIFVKDLGNLNFYYIKDGQEQNN